MSLHSDITTTSSFYDTIREIAQRNRVEHAPSGPTTDRPQSTPITSLSPLVQQEDVNSFFRQLPPSVRQQQPTFCYDAFVEDKAGRYMKSNNQYSVRQGLFGTEYEIGMRVIQAEHGGSNALVVHLEDLYTLDRWQVEFPAADIQYLTEQAGSAKSFPAFVRMLHLGLSSGNAANSNNEHVKTHFENQAHKQSDCLPSVQCELLEPSYARKLLRGRRQMAPRRSSILPTPVDIIHLKGDGGDSGNGDFPHASITSNNTSEVWNDGDDQRHESDYDAQVLLVCYRTEFENVVYPLPLYYMGPPDVRRLQQVLRTMHARVQKIISTYVKLSHHKATQQHLTETLREKEEIQRELTGRIAELEQSFQRKMQTTVVKLKYAVERLESILVGERRAYEQQSAQLKMENFDLRTRLELACGREASLKKQLETYQQSRLYNFRSGHPRQTCGDLSDAVLPTSVPVGRTTRATRLEVGSKKRASGDSLERARRSYNINNPDSRYSTRIAQSYDAGIDHAHYHIEREYQDHVRGENMCGRSRHRHKSLNDQLPTTTYRHSSDPARHVHVRNRPQCRQQSCSPAALRCCAARKRPISDRAGSRQRRFNRDGAGDSLYSSNLRRCSAESVHSCDSDRTETGCCSGRERRKLDSTTAPLRQTYSELTHKQQQKKRASRVRKASDSREQQQRPCGSDKVILPSSQKTRFNPTEYIESLHKRRTVAQQQLAAEKPNQRLKKTPVLTSTRKPCNTNGLREKAESPVKMTSVHNFAHRALSPIGLSPSTRASSSSARNHRKKSNNRCGNWRRMSSRHELSSCEQDHAPQSKTVIAPVAENESKPTFCSADRSFIDDGSNDSLLSSPCKYEKVSRLQHQRSISGSSTALKRPAGLIVLEKRSSEKPTDIPKNEEEKEYTELENDASENHDDHVLVAKKQLYELELFFSSVRLDSG